jgi:hypothetical protein
MGDSIVTHTSTRVKRGLGLTIINFWSAAFHSEVHIRTSDGFVFGALFYFAQFEEICFQFFVHRPVSVELEIEVAASLTCSSEVDRFLNHQN